MLANPFGLQITRQERDNALKTNDLQPLYRSRQLQSVRSQVFKMLHSDPWQTLEEEIVNKDHWWPPVAEDKRGVKGTWMTHFTQDTKLAKMVLSIDWHAYDDDPLKPLIEWSIDTPTSEYHPGKHCGVIYLNCLLSNLKPCQTRVAWKSPIYSPFVQDQGEGNGNLQSERLMEDGLVNFTDLLQSIAHVLLFGPFSPTAETAAPPFIFRPENPHIWKHYETQDAKANKAFKRAASFFSRAYN